MRYALDTFGGLLERIEACDRDNGYRRVWRLDGVVIWSYPPRRHPSPIIREYLPPDPLD